jgi:hypothetical protein
MIHNNPKAVSEEAYSLFIYPLQLVNEFLSELCYISQSATLLAAQSFNINPQFENEQVDHQRQ